MRPGRIIALIVGSLLALPALAMFFSGGILALAYAGQRDDGFFDVTLDPLETTTAAITAEQIDLQAEPGTPRWVLDALETDIRLRVTGADGDKPVFLGIASEQDLDGYLSGVAHDEIDDVDEDLEAAFRSRSGTQPAAAPTDQDFWEVSVSGNGTQELEWEARSGKWAVALMNEDGSPGVAADVNVGIRSAAFLPLALGLLAAGAMLCALAAGLIVFGGVGLRARPETTADPTTGVPEPGTGLLDPTPVPGPYPVTMTAQLDPALSNWQWLVKWILAIPHMIVLAFLFAAFSLLTIVAGVAILFTGRYPRGIFDFNVGVLRWGWRVSYYAFNGGLGTDQYPPFSLDAHPEYPATLNIEYPEQLSRGLVLIKWWLLALPHYVIVAVIAGVGLGWDFGGDWNTSWAPGSGGLVGILSLVAAVILLFRGTYPRQLFDLIIGMNRWVYRVTAYAALMTDVYPPFRLDQGGSEPGTPDSGPKPEPPQDDAVDLRYPVPEATAAL